MDTTFFQKSRKNVDHSQKKSEYTVWMFSSGKGEKGGRFRILGGDHEKNERFSEKTQIFTERLPKKSEYT